MDFSRQDLYDFFCYYCNDDKFFKKLRSEIEKRDSAIKSLAVKVDNCNKELETSRPIIESLSRENELLKSHIRRLGEDNRNLTNDIKKNSQEKVQLSHHNGRLSQQNEQLKNDNEQLKDDIEQLKNDLESLRQGIDQSRTQEPEQDRSSDSDTRSLNLVGMEISKKTFQVSLGSCHKDIDDEKLRCLINIEKMRAGGKVESLEKKDLKQLLKYWKQPIMRNEEELRTAVREMMKKEPKIQRIFIGQSFERPIVTRQTNENSTNQPESTEIYFQCGMSQNRTRSFAIVSFKKSSRKTRVNPNAPHTYV